MKDHPIPPVLPIRPLRRFFLLPTFLLLCLLPDGVAAQSLRGSTASVDLQFRMAQDHDFSFLESPAQVERFVEAGYLVLVRGDRNFELHAVSYPYARPELRTFLTRLGDQYRRACGEKLVVTSLTRPLSRQPVNASSRSVHPTGMAVDIRRTNDMTCRSWLESTLLSLEKQGILEATRESRPPHYHIALFPKPYARYVEALASRDSETRMASAPEMGADVTSYQVRRGDSLWTIARAHGVSVDRLKAENNLSGSRIYAGQLLKVPVVR